MVLHPDAKAFVARFLANPEDRLGRLVFADWLDEQGGESNTAWAHFLRHKAQGEVYPDKLSSDEARRIGRHVRARLTLNRVPATPVLSRLTAFLPASRVWMRIGNFRTPRSAMDLCTQVLARTYEFMPVASEGDHLFAVLAVQREKEFTQILPDVENFLSCRITAFRGDSVDMNRAINEHYGWGRRVIEDGMIIQDGEHDPRRNAWFCTPTPRRSSPAS